MPAQADASSIQAATTVTTPSSTSMRATAPAALWSTRSTRTDRPYNV
jgi:hypothetical protein